MHTRFLFRSLGNPTFSLSFPKLCCRLKNCGGLFFLSNFVLTNKMDSQSQIYKTRTKYSMLKHFHNLEDFSFLTFSSCLRWQMTMNDEPYKLRDSVSEFSELSEFHYFKTTGQLSLHWPGDCNKLRKQFLKSLSVSISFCW